MIGYINSIDTMGLVDGPGIRVVVFLEGCNLGCIFCHNPEMWKITKKNPITPFELVEKIKRYKPYFKNNGGVTFSGGEPLLQSDFLLECLKLCKKENIHTCIDTAGYGNSYDEILDYVDLVLFDIKGTDENMYKKITGKNIDTSLEFLNACIKKNKKLWIRCVIVPGINNTEEYMKSIKELVSKIKNIEKLELLPYHTLGVEKYRKLNIPYSLEDVKDMSNDEIEKLYKYLKD